MADVMAGVFCGVDSNVKPRVGISHNIIILRLYYTATCVSVHLSITGGQWKRFDLETQDAATLPIE